MRRIPSVIDQRLGEWCCLGGCRTVHGDYRGGRCGGNVRFLFLFLINISGVGIISEIHEIGNVEIVLIIFVFKPILFVHDGAIRFNTNKRVKGLWWTYAFGVEEVFVCRCRPKDTREHDIGSERVVKDFIADFAIRSMELL